MPCQDGPFSNAALQATCNGPYIAALLFSCCLPLSKLPLLLLPTSVPDRFLKAAELLKVDPSKCLVVEDAP